MAKQIDLGKVKGTDSKINNKNSITITGTNGITVEMDESTMTLKAPGLKNQERLINSKVDKVEGLSLSTENFTTDLKSKLEGIAINANQTTIDDQLSLSSINPVQNKVVNSEINRIKETIKRKMTTVTGDPGQVLKIGEGGSIEAATPENKMAGFTLQKITIGNPSTKTSYHPGDRYDTTNVTILTHYANGAVFPTSVFTVTPETFSIGDTKATLTFVDGSISKSVDQKITVTKRSLSIPTFTGHTASESNTFVPTFNNVNDQYMTISGKTSITRSESGQQFSTTFTLKNTDETQWSDGSIDPKTVNWTITLATIYGFELNLDESNPANMIRYIEENENYTPAKMYYQYNNFGYGSWEQAWFIKGIRVVMLGYDGQVKYRIDKNNYKKKFTGGSSDVENSDYSGNVMVGIPTVWIKVDTTNETRPKFYFSDNQVDSSYKAYAHTNNSGVVKDYIYMSAYDCWYDNNRIRSLSGQFPKGNQNMDTQRNTCKANGSNYDMGTFSDRMLITLLLMLIGKSTDTQTTFGNGVSNVSTPTSDHNSNKAIKSGTLDDKGLFYGYNTTDKAVKVFGIENFWGNVNKRTLGLIVDNGVIKYKLTKGRQDGSGVDDYSTSSTTGYITSHSVGHDSSFYINDMKAGAFGLLPVYNSRSASRSIYFCDYCYNTSPTSGTLYPASFGGYSGASRYCGAFSCILNWSASTSNWSSGVSLSFKPD